MRDSVTCSWSWRLCGSTSCISTNRSVICNFLIWVAYFVKEIHLVYTVYYPIPVAALGLRSLVWWDCGFKFLRRHWCLSLVSVVFADRGLCDGLITRPEKAYRVIQNPHRWGLGPLGLSSLKKYCLPKFFMQYVLGWLFCNISFICSIFVSNYTFRLSFIGLLVFRCVLTCLCP